VAFGRTERERRAHRPAAGMSNSFTLG